MEQKRKKGKWRWVGLGLLASLAAACCFMASWSHFRTEVKQMGEFSLETEENLEWLYQNTYLLYQELYNRENGTSLDAWELYGASEKAGRSDEETKDREFVETVFQYMEGEYSVLNSLYGYRIQDNKTGYTVSNLSENDLERLWEESDFLVSFVFDGNGNMTVGEELIGRQEEELRRMAMQASRQKIRLEDSGFWRGPVDCTVTYALSWQDLERSSSYEAAECVISDSYGKYGNSITFFTMRANRGNELTLYQQAGMLTALRWLLLLVFTLGLFLPIGAARPWKELSFCRLSAEVEAFLLCGEASFVAAAVFRLAVRIAEGELQKRLGLARSALSLLVPAGGLLVFTAFFFAGWYLGVCLRELRELGPLEYLRRRSLLWRGWKFLLRKGKEKFKAFYRELTHTDLSRENLRPIRRLALINGLISAALCVCGFVGIVPAAIYSLLLYLFLKRYVQDLQRHYDVLLRVTNQIAEGNLNADITEDMGIFEPFRPQLEKIRKGFQRAVEEEVKSQRMKAELITNVSHDLKTPLTAVITYENLLKEPGLPEEKRQEYLEVMEQKTLRLKALIEDLFEVSRANSGDVTLHLMPVDLISLLKQVCLELRDKIADAELDVRMNLKEEKVILPLDSQKTYRVYENLLSNAAKYALKGTRVYVNGFYKDDTYVITIKNISAEELTVDGAELTERFVRGDVSRNTEGSGLGLAIARSFMELQGGRLEVEVDGDLFKATTSWPTGQTLAESV